MLVETCLTIDALTNVSGSFIFDPHAPARVRQYTVRTYMVRVRYAPMRVTIHIRYHVFFLWNGPHFRSYTTFPRRFVYTYIPHKHHASSDIPFCATLRKNSKTSLTKYLDIEEYIRIFIYNNYRNAYENN
jgi:hypothetical protein